jgi:hypothetical protein
MSAVSFRRRVFTLDVTVEEKEDSGRLPNSDELVNSITDQVFDGMKHDVDVPWRVIKINDAASSSFISTQAGSHGYQDNRFFGR